MAFTNCISRPPEITQMPILHVEARVKSNEGGIIVRTDLIRDEVTQWLIDNFVVLTIGQEINSFEGFKGPDAQVLDSIRVTECTADGIESGAYRLQNIELDVQAYQLRGAMEQENSQQTQNLEESAENGDDIPRAKVLTLPSKELDGLWESLQFDQPIHCTLLRAITRMVSLSTQKLNKWSINWNKLILLFGTPGTGKTSLCQGLAQKLAIRLGKHYPQSKLVEINAHSLGSKFFGESAKLVSKIFDSIDSMLEEEEDTFVCVFVDEIETLAASREHMLSGSEPFDAVRAVNALLTGLDRLRHHPNVVFVCTSNLATALDSAFLDRVDIKQFLPHLSKRVIYGIYKACLEELNRCGIIDGVLFDVIQLKPEDPGTPLRYVEQPTEGLEIPNFEEMLLNYQIFPDAIPKQLADLASASIGLSGRTVRRLPALSLVLHTHRTRCSVREAVEALREGIAAEVLAKAETTREGDHGQRPKETM